MSRITDINLQRLVLQPWDAKTTEIFQIAQELLELRAEKQNVDTYVEATNLLVSISSNATVVLMKANKKIRELQAENERLKNVAKKVRDICDKPWGDLYGSIWTIHDDQYLAWDVRDMLDEVLSKASGSGRDET